MTIDPSVVGRPLGTLERDVRWRDTTNFAAAVGEVSPRCLDDTADGGLLAPPTFAVALTWPLLSALPMRLGGALPLEAVPTLVHAGEHLALHRPVRPGDRVAMTGKVVALRPGRAGARLVLRVDASAGREPLFTEFSTVLFRGVGCGGDGAGAALEDAPEGPGDAGSVAWSAAVPVGREVPFAYDGCTGIVFPIHTSVAFARRAGLPDLVVQGTWTLGRALAEVVARDAGGDPSRVREVGCRFAAPVVPPASLAVEGLAPPPGDGAAGLRPFRVVDGGGRAALEGFARLG